MTTPQVGPLSEPALTVLKNNLSYDAFLSLQAPVLDIGVLDAAYENELAALHVKGHFSGQLDPETLPPRRNHPTNNPLSTFERARLEAYDGRQFRIRVDHALYPEFWLHISVPHMYELRIEGAKLDAEGRITSDSALFSQELSSSTERPSGRGIRSNKVNGVRVQSYDEESREVVIRAEDYQRDPAFWLEINLNLNQLEKWIASHEQ